MPHGEDRAGHRRHGKIGERSPGKGRGQPGILHTDLDGQRLCLFHAHLKEFTQAKAAEVSQQVMKNDGRKHRDARAQDLLGIVGNHSGHDQADGDDRNRRKHRGDLLGVLPKELVDDKAEGDGDDHDLDDGNEHTDHIHRNAGPQKEVGDGGRQKRGEHRIHACHTHRQRHVAL